MNSEFVKLAYQLGYKQALFGDSKRKEQAEKMKRVGGYTFLASLVPSLVFGVRGGIRSRKALKLMRKGVMSAGDVDSYIAKHIASSGKTLPKYSWGAAKGDAIPVFRNLEGIAENAQKHGLPNTKVTNFIMRLAQRIQGPNFNPVFNHIYLGDKVNPKVLLHELGHAQDLKQNGLEHLMNTKDGFRGSLRNIFNPDNSRLVQREMRAWDNAGIAASDELREAALNTYRNSVQARPFLVAAMPATWAGAYMHAKGHKMEKDLEDK